MKIEGSLTTQLTEVPLERPCSEPWDEMTGDDRVRRCAACDRDVYDLSAMSRIEAELRLLNAGTTQPCIRYLRADDGGVLHLAPSPSLLVRPRSRTRSLVAAASVSVTLAASSVRAEDKAGAAKQPEQCVAYVTQAEVDGAVAVAAAARAPAARATGGPTAKASAGAASAGEISTEGAGGTTPSSQMYVAGGPRSAPEPPISGTLQMKSKVPRQVTIVGIRLTAPLTYQLGPGRFTADVADPDGKTRQVKFKITARKQTVLDLDKR